MKSNLPLESKLFKISIFLKGAYSLLELLAGALLFSVTSQQLYSFIDSLFTNELLEDAHDFIANSILHLVRNMPSAIRMFTAIYLMVHGIIKLVLIIGLWKRKRAAYPIAISVFSLFIVYQIYRYIVHPSLMLLLFSDLDMLIIILTLVEWRKMKKGNARKKGE